MKKIFKLSALIAAMVLGKASFAQLQDEQDVTMTMDLQPILQLSMEGPDQIDFTFDEINKYYTGVIKTGANILRVSASVSFDLWAVGVSTGANLANGLVWDNPVSYGTASVGAGFEAQNLIPLTALELHQFPANPVVGAGCAAFTPINGDYSSQFAPFDMTANGLGVNLTNKAASAANILGNNAIYCTSPGNVYVPPLSVGPASAATEKYIAGASGTTTGCQVNAGSWLFGGFTAGAVTNIDPQQGALPAGGAESGYYFVMDYRILPGLPAKFPSTQSAFNIDKSVSLLAAAAQGTINGTTSEFAAPGVYTMFVKYILAEDQ